MGLQTFYKLLLDFFFFSFVGWVCESTYCSIGAKKLINRGFLNGPVCPVYGVGALLVTASLRPLRDNWALVFLLGMLITSVVEYVTGYLLERLFHTKWWDYSKRRFNLHGRVCLRNSLMFGALCVVLMAFLQPMEQRLLRLLPTRLLPFLALGLLALLIVDTAVTVHTMLQINGKLSQLEQVFAEINAKKEEAKLRLQQNLEQRLDEETMARLEHLYQRVKELEEGNKLLQRRLLRAFPNMRSTRPGRQEALNRMKEAIHQRLYRGKKDKRQNKH